MSSNRKFMHNYPFYDKEPVDLCRPRTPHEGATELRVIIARQHRAEDIEQSGEWTCLCRICRICREALIALTAPPASSQISGEVGNEQGNPVTDPFRTPKPGVSGEEAGRGGASKP